MIDKELLIQAQMHLEYLNESLLSMKPAMDQLLEMDGMEALGTSWHEANARTWAAIHLIQSAHLGRVDEQLAEALREANAFNRKEVELHTNTSEAP